MENEEILKDNIHLNQVKKGVEKDLVDNDKINQKDRAHIKQDKKEISYKRGFNINF